VGSSPSVPTIYQLLTKGQKAWK